MAISAYQLRRLTNHAATLGIGEGKLAELAGTDYLTNMSAAEGRALEARLDAIGVQQTATAKAATEQATDEPAPAGWSNASRVRRDESGHPFGKLVERQGGRSVYRDHSNGGRVEIWDNE